jgi:hypothetical protein
VDTIIEIGPAAFQCPDTDVSYSPTRGLENGERSVVVIYHTSETGDEIIMLTDQKSTLSKEKKAQFSTLWRACVELRMFSPCRAASIIHQGNALLQDIKEGGLNQDPESDRQQRMIVLESTLAAGLGSVLYDYVIAQAATSNAFSQGDIMESRVQGLLIIHVPLDFLYKYIVLTIIENLLYVIFIPIKCWSFTDSITIKSRSFRLFNLDN